MESPALQPKSWRHSNTSPGRAARWMPRQHRPAQKRGIGGVDNGVDAQRCDVGDNNLELRTTNSARQPDQAADAPT
jgi:hypothetical protein